jgi:hypothetical protein
MKPLLGGVLSDALPDTIPVDHIHHVLTECGIDVDACRDVTMVWRNGAGMLKAHGDWSGGDEGTIARMRGVDVAVRASLASIGLDVDDDVIGRVGHAVGVHVAETATAGLASLVGRDELIRLESWRFVCADGCSHIVEVSLRFQVLFFISCSQIMLSPGSIPW